MLHTLYINLVAESVEVLFSHGFSRIASRWQSFLFSNLFQLILEQHLVDICQAHLAFKVDVIWIFIFLFVFLWVFLLLALFYVVRWINKLIEGRIEALELPLDELLSVVLVILVDVHALWLHAGVWHWRLYDGFRTVSYGHGSQKSDGHQRGNRCADERTSSNWDSWRIWFGRSEIQRRFNRRLDHINHIFRQRSIRLSSMLATVLFTAWCIIWFWLGHFLPFQRRLLIIDVVLFFRFVKPFI